MPFVLEATVPPSDYDFFDRGEHDCMALCYLGADQDKGSTYFAAVALGPYQPDRPEYYFYIVERNSFTGETVEHWTGKSIHDEFTKQDRWMILGVVCYLTEMILNIKRPKQVDRCTHDHNPPEKSMDKHYMISRVFVGCGYRVLQCDDWNGKRVWLATLGDSEIV
ncbi:hypothetical protein [Azospirillum sp. TSH64]|uniref:hypothetical protein n=1 Tax=Azospirillum sp. TSH64 TaxID=652740 RepID=UPI0011B2586C|nr:hypothetical protein [Azospirillum sp. TSH64]